MKVAEYWAVSYGAGWKRDILCSGTAWENRKSHFKENSCTTWSVQIRSYFWPVFSRIQTKYEDLRNNAITSACARSSGTRPIKSSSSSKSFVTHLIQTTRCWVLLRCYSNQWLQCHSQFYNEVLEPVTWEFHFVMLSSYVCHRSYLTTSKG